MNILILTRVTNKDGNSIYNSYTKGIVNNYPESIVIDYLDLYFNNAKKDFEAKILEIIDKEKIDLIFINFVSADFTFEINFLHYLSQKCFMMMNFYDSELFFEPLDRYYAQCADLVLLPTSSVFIENYSLLGINAISTLSLFDIKMYKNLDIKKDIEVSFVGDLSKKSRRDFIEYIQKQGIQIEVFGKGSKNGSLSFDGMIDIFNRSKINLNFSDTSSQRTFNKDINTDYSIVPKIVEYMTQLKGRTIEVSLCGSFTLTQNAVGIEELFSLDEIDIFNTKEELVSKILFYLEEDEQREVMALKAYNKAIKKFDATSIFKKIFQNINLQERQSKTIFMDKDFLKNYTSYHALYLFNFLFKGKIKLFFKELQNIKFNQLKPYSVSQHFLQQLRYRIERGL
jgi:hypothetical protein